MVKRLPLVAWMSRQGAVHLAHLSTPRGLRLYSRVLPLFGADSVGYFHGEWLLESVKHQSPSERSALRKWLSTFNHLWATSEPVADLLDLLGFPGAATVSPYVGTEDRLALDAPPRRDGSLLVAVWMGKKLYGAHTAVSAVRKLREADAKWHLSVILYGPATRESAILTAEVSHVDGVTILPEQSEQELDQLLMRTEVLLRPTTTDGDSLLVRKALDAGARVVASDAVPRPRGVETCGCSADEIASALLRGGRVADGSGLGVSCAQMLEAIFGER